MIKRLMCWLTGHARGKRTGIEVEGKAQFECPRCKATWARKDKAKAS